MTPKTKAKSHDLPKHAPKRTGKKGIHARELSGDLVEQDAARSAGDDEKELLRTPENAAKKPKQARLKGMEDPKIAELEGLAEDYVEVRDERQALTPREVQLKNDLISAMERHGKASYVHAGVEIKVLVESKKLKVRIRKDE